MNDTIKLYLDEDMISRSLLRALRSRAVDVLTATEAKLIQASDERHLKHATSLKRTLLTFNTRDFVMLHRKYMAEERKHAGIIVSAQIEPGVLLRRLLTFLNARSASDMKNWLEYLSNWR